MSTDADPPPAISRTRVRAPLRTGVRVVDLFTPLCVGQRIGIFAGSGVGKTTLLSMLAQSPGFDTVVTALVGERGREVREFLEETLVHHKSRAVTVVSTSDESPMMRRLAAKTATTIAEYFRDRGELVLLIVDSITRFAHAAREVALATGEPAVARGYAPSVFSDLPRLLERSGPGTEGQGSITGIYAVLVDGDDHNEPVADTVRSTLDGHIVLDREVADQGRYPAVNVLSSVSRLAQTGLVCGGAQPAAQAARHDRSFRGHARSSPDGWLSARPRQRTRSGRAAGAEDLRRDAAGAVGSGEHRTVPGIAGRDQERDRVAGARSASSAARRAPIAFSSEVHTGSREENASKQKSRASVLIQSEPIML